MWVQDIPTEYIVTLLPLLPLVYLQILRYLRVKEGGFQELKDPWDLGHIVQSGDVGVRQARELGLGSSVMITHCKESVSRSTNQCSYNVNFYYFIGPAVTITYLLETLFLALDFEDVHRIEMN